MLRTTGSNNDKDYTPQQQPQQQQHPMVAVQDAIRIVLIEACHQLLLLQQQQQQQQQSACVDRGTSTVNSSSDSYSEEIFLYNSEGKSTWNQLQGRILLEDVYMRFPGYPPYAASIMDGYAIALTDGTTGSSSIHGEDIHIKAATSQWTHIVKNKIYAGDDPTNETIIGEQTLESKTSTSIALNMVGSNDVNNNDNENVNDDDDDIQSMTSSQLNLNDSDYDVNNNELDIAPTDLLDAYYVTTGAMIPNNCNAVIPMEHVTIHNTTVSRKIAKDINPSSTSTMTSTMTTLLQILPSAISALPKNKWIRQPGSDIAQNTLLVPKHTVLDPIAIGLLYQSGISSVRLRRKINIGVLSTGSELYVPSPTIATTNSANAKHSQDWWTYLQASCPGTIPDINRPILLSLLTSSVHDVYRQNINVIDLGIIRDDKNVDDISQQFKVVIDQCDIILSTGGISLGETDFIENIIMNHLSLSSQLHFGRLHMKPGKPTTFFSIPKASYDTESIPRSCLWFAMPGNPVSNYVCTHLLVLPALHLLIHGIPKACPVHDSVESVIDKTYIANQIVPYLYVHNEIHKVTLQHDIHLDPERPEYHRVVFVDCSYDNTTVQSTGVQQSSRLLSLNHADGVLVLPQGTIDHPVAKAGEAYTMIRLFDRNVMLTTQVQESIHMLLPFDTNLLSKQSSGLSLKALGNDTLIIGPDTKTDAMTMTNKNAESTTPVLNVGIIHMSPVHSIDMIGDLNDSRNDASTGTELAREETTTVPLKHMEEIAIRVKHALSGNKSGPVQVVFNLSYNGPVDRLHQYLLDQVIPGESNDENKEAIDILVLIGTSIRHESSNGHYRSPFHRYMQVAHMLRHRLEKMAISMSLFAKQHAAKQDPIVGALFEIVIGYMYTINMNEDQPKSNPDQSVVSCGDAVTDVNIADGRDASTLNASPKNGCIVIFVPEECLETSLSCIRSVIKHALQVAQKEISLTETTATTTAIGP